MQHRFFVNAEWDGEANVWVATSDDIPGLVTEAATLDALLQRVMAVAPELLEDNAHLLNENHRPGRSIDLCILSQLPLDQHAH